MTKLQASMKDKSAQRWRENKLYYKVGSCFKGCHYCGDFDVEVSESGREKKSYTSGYQVFRAYNPSSLGWTYWCYECGAKDALAWENADDLGRDAIRGSRSAISAAKAAARKDSTKANAIAPQPLSRSAEIARLEAELVRLMEMLKTGK